MANGLVGNESAVNTSFKVSIALITPPINAISGPTVAANNAILTITSFIGFGNSKPVDTISDPINLLKQLAPKIDNNALKEILPSILTLLANPENKAALNPTVLSSMLANLGAKKEE
jgi:hypothetical protein